MPKPIPEYHIPDAVLTAHLQGEAVLLDMNSRRYFQLNRTAADLWRQMERGADHGALLDHLCGEYDVAPEEATRQLTRILGELAELGLVQPAPAGEDTEK